MRPFELLTLLPNLLYLILRLVPRTRAMRWVSALPLLAAVFGLAHLLIERSRWQMVPVYVLAALLLLMAAIEFKWKSPIRAGWARALLALLVIGALPALLLPIPRIAQPTGPYAVGTSVFAWTDEGREEIYPQPSGAPRRIMVQVWYPAEPLPGSPREPYLRDIETLYPYIAAALEMPGFTLSHLTLAQSNAYTGAPLPAGIETYPVLVFSHGWTGFRTQNLAQMEWLASRGYVVFSADHTYGAAAVAFPDGELAVNYEQALPSNVTQEEYDRAARKLGQTFVGDIRFVLDQAERINSGEIASPLAGRLDLTRVGTLGHSTGAGAAIETCWVDARCKAGLAMDPWLIPYDREMVRRGLDQPMLWMHSESWSARRNKPLQDSLFANLRGGAYRLYLDGSNHYTFSDTDLFMPLIARLRSGRLTGPTHQDLINDYTLAFFDQYLKGQPSTLLAPGASALTGTRLERTGP